MKKTLLLLASAALLLVGCAKEQLSNGLEGELTKVTFTASLDNGVATKAVDDGDGAAASVNRCIMEIYYGDELFARQIEKVTDKHATFTAQVVSNRTYKVAFWADKVDATTEAGLQVDKYYTTNATGGLQAITINGSYIGNDDARDAFFHVGNYTVAQAGSSFGSGDDKILLRRPFAQMNVITTDWDKVKTIEALKPGKVSVTLKNPMVKFNAVTGVSSADANTPSLEYTADVYVAPAPTGTAPATDKTLSMDYLFASDTKALIDIDWKALHGTDTPVAHAFAAVPYQRNYRTNIKGALLTTQGQWTVTVDSDWTGNGSTVEGGTDPYLVNYFAAGSIAAANEALKTNNAVSIENPSDLGTAVVVPAEQDGKSVLIKVAGASAGDITVQKATDNGPASLAIESDSKTLNIDLPNSHVDVNKGANYTQITAKTGDNTLVIGKDVVAANLDVQKGSVEIHGKVDFLNRAAGISAKFYASDGTTLANYVTWAKAGETVELECDIDLVGTTWNSPELNADFNGNGHIIKNIKNLACAPDYAGLFRVSYSNIKNVTIQNAEFAYDNSSKDARGGALVGDMRMGSVENCHVDGVKFTGYQKVGGLVGFLSKNADNGTDISIKNCSVKNATFAACGADDEYLYQTGGLIGYIQLGNRNISISNCSVDHITFDNTKYNGVYDEANTNDGYLSHTFVGAIFSDTNNAENTLSFTANTISTTSGENTPLKANMYGSAYFGWARNPEYKSNTPVTLGKITIDGEEWTPNYPVKNVTKGKGYPTLAKAVADASAGDKITLVNGVYELPSSLSNITLEGIGDNVIASNTVSGTSNVTLKKFIINFPNGNYKGFQHASNLVLEGCTINGLITTYGSTTFKKCTFNVEEYAYNMNAYGAEIVCENCTFNGKGKAVYVYNEGNDGSMYHISFNNCVFNEEVGAGTKCKAAILVKENHDNQKYVVNINNCEANFDKYVPDDPDYTGSSLWNMELKDGVTGTDVTVNLNNEKVYPFTSFKVSDAAGLRNAIKMFNKGKEQVEYSIELADGTYEVSDMPIIQAAKKSLVVKAKNEGKAILTPDAGTKTNMIFLISGGGLSTTGDEWVTFEGLKFNMPNDPGKITSAVFCTAQNDATYSPLVGESMTRYAHNITVRNCELQGCGSENSSLLKAAQGAGANIAVVDNCVVNHSGYVVSDYFSNVIIVDTKVTDTKACANIANEGITVEGCNISTYHDYCIRTNGGAVVVKGNTFKMTYDGTSTTAGIVVLRGTGNQASISDNTITKAVNNMWDCYCAKAWTVNGEAKAAGTGINF